MMFRAIVSCVAMVLGLLAALNVTAQSAGACNGASCGSTQPLNLMNFTNGSGKAGTAKTAAPAATASAKKTKHRHPVKAATRAPEEAAAPPPEQPASPAAASAETTEHSADDVQVVSGDEVNAIDLAMGKADKPAAETNGTAPDAGGDNPDRAKWADAKEFRTEQYKPSSAPPPATDTTSNITFRDDTWMGRFWSVIGDGYVALMAMIQQLFARL